MCGRPAITLPDKAKPRDLITCELPGENRTRVFHLRHAETSSKHALTAEKGPAARSFKGLSPLTKAFPHTADLQLAAGALRELNTSNLRHWKETPPQLLSTRRRRLGALLSTSARQLSGSYGTAEWQNARAGAPVAPGRPAAGWHRPAVNSATAGREGHSQPALGLKANHRRRAPRPQRDGYRNSPGLFSDPCRSQKPAGDSRRLNRFPPGNSHSTASSSQQFLLDSLSIFHAGRKSQQ